MSAVQINVENRRCIRAVRPRLCLRDFSALRVWNWATRDKRLEADVEVHCGLAAGGPACQPGQEEPGASIAPT